MKFTTRKSLKVSHGHLLKWSERGSEIGQWCTFGDYQLRVLSHQRLRLRLHRKCLVPVLVQDDKQQWIWEWNPAELLYTVRASLK